jgi:kynurenine formamidase
LTRTANRSRQRRSKLIWVALFVDLSEAFLRSKEKYLITIDDFQPHAEEIAETRLLVKTGRWSNSAVFPKQIPVISRCPIVAQKNGVKLLGLDLPSVDEIDSKSLQNHHALARAGVAIVESLDLNSVGPEFIILRRCSENRRRRWRAVRALGD